MLMVKSDYVGYLIEDVSDRFREQLLNGLYTVIDEIATQYTVTISNILKPLDQLELPRQTYRVLKGIGITTIGEVTQKTEKELLSIPGIGKKGIVRVKTELSKHSLELNKETAESGQYKS